MDDSYFLNTLNNVGNFKLRRAVERLREGLFDPLGVKLLTAGEADLNRAFGKGALDLEKNSAAHLCICGSYGQGKSHSLTYIKEQALSQSFVVSQINLDPREIPFHDFKRVYTELITRIKFPGTETSLINHWKTWIKQQNISFEKNNGQGLLNMIPDEMPHLFKSVMAALAQNNISLSDREKRLKKHAAFRPREFPYLLSRALLGESVPVYRLKKVFKYRQVSFYKEDSLSCKGPEPYLNMTYALARLFKNMGFSGWVLLFDEGESIVQSPVFSRSKSYKILNRIFFSEKPMPGFYPIFAFTEDFFLKVEEEDYERTRIRNEIEIPYFDQNYAKAWRDLNIYRLHDLSPKQWEHLSEKLMLLHAEAYAWQPFETNVYDQIRNKLKETGDLETRFKLKALVEQLDIAHQKRVLKNY
ncbi:MAG: DUF2791 family P-loop domain-containing protein [Desulfobacterales bacterium]|nr:DUF2791 family P-loop domain-containing protein [Desulfobacterales bacterium]